jgi:sugar phosphate isomerase/epimerase
MKDMREHLEKLQVQIVECEIIRDLATDPKKRELFARLAEHHRALALEIKRAMGTDTKPE